MIGILEDRPRSGRPKEIAPDQEAALIDKTLHCRPKDATHWSVRSMAREQGLSPATVQRIWSKHHLQPHRVESFKFSTDPEFVTKVRDIVGLYLNPPDKAIVLSVDEKSQIQALDRTQPILPLRPSLPERQTHDYERHGTTTLFAALDVAAGKIIGQCQPRHRHQEFLRFLDKIDAAIPGSSSVHLILDNYGTHKHPDVKKWFAEHPHYRLHFTPTSASWLNQVERWFAEITRKRLRRGTFRSVRELEKAIRDHCCPRQGRPVTSAIENRRLGAAKWAASDGGLRLELPQLSKSYEHQSKLLGGWDEGRRFHRIVKPFGQVTVGE